MNAEEAVRQYLLYLEDPSKLRDEEKIKQAEAAVRSATDPIERLKAHAALERAQAVDGSEYREAFIRSARAWADANGVSAAAFQALGVPEQDLRAAGILGRGRGRTTRARGGQPGPRRGRVTIEDIKRRVPSGEFTLRQLQEITGASPATIRKAVSEMVDKGEIKELGPDQSHGRRGKAPILYRKG